MTEFLADGPDWHFVILNWCLILILLCRWWVNWFWYAGTPWIQFLRIRCCRRHDWTCKNVSRCTMRVPNMLGGPFLRLGIPVERLGNMGMFTAYWFSILKISWINHTITLILQFLYLACKFKNSISIFDQFSRRKCIECRTLKALRFFHLTEAFVMSFTKIPILLQLLFMKKLLILSTAFFYLGTMKFFLLRLDRFTHFLYISSVIISLEFVFLISAWQSARICSLCGSKGVLTCSFSEFCLWICDLLQRVAPFYRDFCHCSQRVAPFYPETLTTTTDQTTGLLVRSDRLVFGMRWRASDRLRHRRNPCLRGTVAWGTVARLRTPDWTRRKSLWGSSPWAHNLWGRKTRH